MSSIDDAPALTCEVTDKAREAWERVLARRATRRYFKDQPAVADEMLEMLGLPVDDAVRDQRHAEHL